MNQNEFIVIAFLLKNNKAVSIAQLKLRSEYFLNPALRTFYNVLLKSSSRKIVVTFNVLDQMLRKRNYRKELYDCFANLINYKSRDADEFNYAMNQMILHYKKRILINGVTNISQDIIGDDVSKAEKNLKQLVKNVDRARLESDGITLNIRKDIDESKKIYDQIEYEIKNEGHEKNRTKTGINYIDAITGGGKRGELWIWGAYTSEGKTAMAKEIAYRACTMYGKNVLFITLEMTIEEIKNILETRHSHKFIPGGLLSKKIELGTLTPEEKIGYYKTLDDWEKNQTYGNFTLWSPPYGCTIDQIGHKLEELNYESSIDLVVVDYAELLHLAHHSNQDYRIQVKSKMEQLKDLARTFDNNKGIWILSPHQISRKGKESAEKRGYYVLADLAESAGVERTANLVGWNLVTQDLQAEGKVRIGISKYRTGSIDQRGTELMADWKHAFLEEISDVSELDGSEF